MRLSQSQLDAILHTGSHGFGGPVAVEMSFYPCLPLANSRVNQDFVTFRWSCIVPFLAGEGRGEEVYLT
eukprot:3791209-Amphidinium_carterae.1